MTERPILIFGGGEIELSSFCVGRRVVGGTLRSERVFSMIQILWNDVKHVMVYVQSNDCESFMFWYILEGMHQNYPCC